jgi:pyruvate formate lyase activating enzyme
METPLSNYGIKGFIPTSMLDWPGKVCSVIFLGGCGFRCPACHNHKLVLNPESMPDVLLSDILKFLASRKAWIDGVAITGGEPTLRKDLPQLLEIFRGQGHLAKLDTNGSNPRMLEKILSAGLVQGVSMDIKAPLNREAYARVAGVPVDVDAILKSIQMLKAADLDVTFRTTVIPGLVEEAEVGSIRKSIGDVPGYSIQAFRNTDTLAPDFADIEEFDLERVENMRKLFEVPSNKLAEKRYSLAG